MVATRRHTGDLPSPIETLERLFQEGGKTLIQAVFENSFFVSPDAVRERTPWYPTHARKSREHYPGIDKGKAGNWRGQVVTLDDNSHAQKAWAKYSGRPVARGSGYGVRHIWGNPWDPIAFTAGWNIVYMPFWAGMLTEDQHPHPEIQLAIKQAGWDLYFRNDPVCEAPDFVTDPGADLATMLQGQELHIIAPKAVDLPPPGAPTSRDAALAAVAGDVAATVRLVRTQSNASWSNLRKAVRALQGLEHDPFSTTNVEANSKSHVRRMVQVTGLELPELAVLIDELAGG